MWGRALLCLALAGCATSYSGPLYPRVDHHQHLLSPAGAEGVNRPAPAEIAVPAPIAQILRARAEYWNDAGALRALYADDARTIGWEAPGWVDGAEGVATLVGGRFARAYQLTPIAYREFGQAAEVTGYYSRGEGEARQHIGYFSMTLRRVSDGSWRILTEIPVFPGPRVEPTLDGAGLVALLDDAHIERAVVFSDAYYFDAPRDRQGDYYAQVRAENDWTAAQVALFPDRLIAFCSFNPLENYALTELQRCAESGSFRGLKLHFDTSEVDLANGDHIARVRAVYAEANQLDLPIVAHLSTGPDYDAADAQTFVDEILPAAPDVPVVVAHLSGGGVYRDDALGVFAAAVRDGGADNLYFELAQITLMAGASLETRQQVAARMREIGLERIFYGSDGPQFGGRPPGEMWSEFMTRIPLTNEEFVQIARNVAPYAR